MKESPFIAVLKRELDRMVSRRIYFASCIVLPLFSIFFMATILVTDRWRICLWVLWMVIIQPLLVR
ncbi:transmembrane protein [Phocaeicola vulgatus]|mgnify:CR=1 FL=1|nr:transmembrane protein [Phocaeicola vulgatus]